MIDRRAARRLLTVCPFRSRIRINQTVAIESYYSTLKLSNCRLWLAEDPAHRQSGSGDSSIRSEEGDYFWSRHGKFKLEHILLSVDRSSCLQLLLKATCGEASKVLSRMPLPASQFLEQQHNPSTGIHLQSRFTSTSPFAR